MPLTQYCSRCGEDKPLNEFSPMGGSVAVKYPNRTYYWWCKSCDHKRDHERTRKKRQSLRLRVLMFYSNGSLKCLCCGAGFSFLTIDHIHGGGRQHRLSLKGQGDLYKWLVANNFPPGFRALCYNCNLGRARNGGICPHEEERLAAQAAD